MVMEKTAQNAAAVFSQYVAFLRALYLLHQRNHWETKGYADHLLFQRLYEGTQEMADEAAEKAIGIFGTLGNQKGVSKLAEKYYNASDPVAGSLKAEEAFQKLCKDTYDSLEASKKLTLGLDDMIMAHASKSELHTYLLQQAA